MKKSVSFLMKFLFMPHWNVPRIYSYNVSMGVGFYRPQILSTVHTYPLGRLLTCGFFFSLGRSVVIAEICIQKKRTKEEEKPNIFTLFLAGFVPFESPASYTYVYAYGRSAGPCRRFWSYFHFASCKYREELRTLERAD